MVLTEDHIGADVFHFYILVMTFVHMWPHPLPHTFDHNWEFIGNIETKITANTCIFANVNIDFHIPDVVSLLKVSCPANLREIVTLTMRVWSHHNT